MDLCDSDAIFMGHRQFSMFGKDIEAAMLEILIDPDKQLCDIPALVEDPEVKKFNESMKIEMNVILQGMTEKDLEWKELAIDAILEKNGGWKNERCQQPDMNEWMMMYFLRMGHKNLNYALCGSYEGHFGLAMSSVTKAVKYCEEAFALKKEWEEKDTFMARVGGDATMGAVSCEGGGSGSLPWEFFAHFDAHDKESIRKTCEYFEVTNKWQLERGLGPDFGKSNGNMRRPDGYGYTQEQHNEIFSQMPNPLPFIYQYKLREAYNPNNLASSYYQTLDPAYLEKNKA